MAVEAVTHALRWTISTGDSQTTDAPILTDSVSLLEKVKSGMGSLDSDVSKSTFENPVMCRNSLSKTPVGVLHWTCRSEEK